jgi:hypothetical protein
MPPKANPLKLNKLQLKTLTILQELAGDPGITERDDVTGGTRIIGIPAPHGNHFHVGARVVMSSDATGLNNEGVWLALVRKGLAAAGVFPFSFVVTPAGLGYDTGIRDQILHGTDH